MFCILYRLQKPRQSTCPFHVNKWLIVASDTRSTRNVTRSNNSQRQSQYMTSASRSTRSDPQCYTLRHEPHRAAQIVKNTFLGTSTYKVPTKTIHRSNHDIGTEGRFSDCRQLFRTRNFHMRYQSKFRQNWSN